MNKLQLNFSSEFNMAFYYNNSKNIWHKIILKELKNFITCANFILNLFDPTNISETVIVIQYYNQNSLISACVYPLSQFP